MKNEGLRFRLALRQLGALLASAFLLHQVGCAPQSGVDGDLISSETAQGEQASAPEAQSKPVNLTAADLEGKSLEQVRAALGAPAGEMKSSKGTAWNYPGWYIEFTKEGVVAKVESLKAATASPGNTTVPDAKPVMTLAKGGAQVDIRTLMPPGKVTIVDFYADWCGPCRAISPKLEKLAREDPDVVLRKVDIVKWGTPVTRQYSISSVPNIRVYDRSKKPVGSPTHDLRAVMRLVGKAK